LPFLLLGFVPALRRRLPKPGPWMARLRRILSLPMFLTALALAWILYRQAGWDGLAIGVGAALMAALILWWAGRRHAWLPMAPALVAAAVAIFLVPAAPPPGTRAQGLLNAERFSEARLARRLAEGRPVFVYFTADWCLTCKVNESAALERKEVADAFASRDVAVLVGDWTRGDAEIGRFLASHGRSGVPLYLYYAPGKEVEILPQILTPGRLAALGA
jgi:thiol:disulfide interchange protein